MEPTRTRLQFSRQWANSQIAWNCWTFSELPKTLFTDFIYCDCCYNVRILRKQILLILKDSLPSDRFTLASTEFADIMQGSGWVLPIRHSKFFQAPRVGSGCSQLCADFRYSRSISALCDIQVCNKHPCLHFLRTKWHARWTFVSWCYGELFLFFWYWHLILKGIQVSELVLLEHKYLVLLRSPNC